MKLTERELTLLANIETRKKRRKLSAWITLIGAIALMLLTERYGWLTSVSEAGIPAILLGAAGAYVAHVYFAVRPEDKLLGLLQRYVNQDPDAVQQLGR